MVQACSQKTVSLPIEDQCLKVLLVDHDVKYMNHMAKVLEQHSCRVTPMEVSSAALSLVYSTKSEYDVIIIDIDMPGMDGFTFMEKTMPKQIPVILTSWRGDVSLMVKAFNEGACFFFQKPIADVELASLWIHVYRYKYLKAKRIKLNSEYQSPTRPGATPHSTTLALTRMKDIAGQNVSTCMKAIKQGIHLQNVGFSGTERVKSTNKTGKGFFPQIIHEMGLYTNGPILDEKSGKIQENSSWNMLAMGKSPCIQELKNSLAMTNNKSSLLGSDNKEEQVNTKNLTEFNYETNNIDTFFFEIEEAPKDSDKMIGKNEIDDETQGLLSYYGFSSNYEENCQSGKMPHGDASGSHIVEQCEGNSGTFEVNETFENFVDHQFEVQMEMFFKSFEDDAYKGII